MHTRTQRIRTSLLEPKIPASDSVHRFETRSTRHQRKGHDGHPETIWHNYLYGIGAAGMMLAPLLIPGIGYVNVMFGVTAVALGIFLVVSLVGIFQGFLPTGRQAQTGRYRRHQVSYKADSS